MGVAALLAVVGIVLAVNASSLPSVQAPADPIGTRPVPFIVAGLLLTCAEVEGGEDVDLSHPTDWKTVGLLLLAFVANILLIERVGFVISGTVLFWGSVIALGGRHYVRDAVISVIVTVLAFYGFYVGLGIKLPPGILAGVL